MNNFIDQVLAPFIHQVEIGSDRLACVVNGEAVLYSAFGMRVYTIAEQIKDWPGDAIGLYTDNSVDTYAAIWAIWLVGKHYVPVHPQAPVERNLLIFREAGVLKSLRASEMVLWPTKNGDAILGLKALARERVHDEQGAYVLFTSGSTGSPKGVVISKMNLAAFVLSFKGLGYSISERDKVLQMFELTFDLSILCYLMAFLFGASMYTVPNDLHKMNGVAMLLEEEAITIGVFVPSLVHYFKPYFDELFFPALRLSIFCGEPLQESLVAGWSACCSNAQIDNIYGPTENTVVCTRYTYMRDAKNKGRLGVLSLGRVMSGNRLLLLNEQGEEVGEGELGEIVMAGPQLSSGYLGDGELNKRAFFNREENGEVIRYYRSGDIGVQDEDGLFNFIERLDFQVKIQGHRVELGEIEYHIRQVLGADKSILAQAIKNNQEQFEVVVFVVGKEFDTTMTVQALRAFLPAYMLPTQWCFVDEFPVNRNGKTDRKQLAQAWLLRNENG